MRKNLIYILAFLGFSTTGIGLFLYWRLKELLSKGEIVIDLDPKMPEGIRNLLYAQKWFPKRIPIKTLMEARAKKYPAQRALEQLAGYFKISLTTGGQNERLPNKSR